MAFEGEKYIQAVKCFVLVIFKQSSKMFENQMVFKQCSRPG